MDFTRQPTRSEISLVSGRGHYDTVVEAVRQAKRSIWIATANLKELMRADGGSEPKGPRGQLPVNPRRL